MMVKLMSVSVVLKFVSFGEMFLFVWRMFWMIYGCWFILVIIQLILMVKMLRSDDLMNVLCNRLFLYNLLVYQWQFVQNVNRMNQNFVVIMSWNDQKMIVIGGVFVLNLFRLVILVCGLLLLVSYEVLLGMLMLNSFFVCGLVILLRFVGMVKMYLGMQLLVFQMVFMVVNFCGWVLQMC